MALSPFCVPLCSHKSYLKSPQGFPDHRERRRDRSCLSIHYGQHAGSDQVGVKERISGLTQASKVLASNSAGIIGASPDVRQSADDRCRGRLLAPAPLGYVRNYMARPQAGRMRHIARMPIHLALHDVRRPAETRSFRYLLRLSLLDPALEQLDSFWGPGSVAWHGAIL
jgi:hypothetical protein